MPYITCKRCGYTDSEAFFPIARVGSRTNLLRRHTCLMCKRCGYTDDEDFFGVFHARNTVAVIAI